MTRTRYHSDLREKVCISCSSSQPIGNYYTHPQMADGHLNKCKQCCKEDTLTNRARNLEKVHREEREEKRTCQIATTIQPAIT